MLESKLHRNAPVQAAMEAHNILLHLAIFNGFLFNWSPIRSSFLQSMCRENGYTLDERSSIDVTFYSLSPSLAGGASTKKAHKWNQPNFKPCSKT